MCPDGKIPPGTLIEGRKGITDKLKQFMFMKDLDKNNEKWKGPRKYTLPGNVSKSDVTQIEQNKKAKALDERSDEAEGILAAENYMVLKESMARNQRRTTEPPVRKRKQGLLAPAESITSPLQSLKDSQDIADAEDVQVKLLGGKKNEGQFQFKNDDDDDFMLTQDLQSRMRIDSIKGL